MNLLDLTLSTPAENLACDEALLDACEGGGPEVLRFWEPREHFVVVGYANHVATEVNRAACEAAGVPIFRRCSGGGTVVQGPGCLNYSLILRISSSDELRNITSTNQFVMDRNRLALQALFSKSKIKNQKSKMVSAVGHTDLAAGALKFSGNAQRRRRHALLFHGTFLLNFDLHLIEKLLPMPSKQPDYRAGRSHRDFLANVPFSAEMVKAALIEAWGALGPLDRIPHETIQSFVRDKYETKEWNFKF